ncbi:hypothetical protein QVD17_18506 [Tagetes erecta]|uniref:BZIP domain-containing protein n=1 Tax=Tagetes erecta TaxID=13708 RepID=A0AAD8NP24_TARER|nr:hypothetical protein QVD17_18506 [Tagetes erecta]
MARNYTHYQDISTFTNSFHNIQSTLLTNIPYYHHQPPLLNFTHQSSSSISCNNSSTSDEAEEQHMSIINDDRKQRRMISNRESARRSRMRKQKQLDELCTQLLRLRNENHGIINRMNNFMETHEQVVQENDRLKKQILELKQLLSHETQIATTYNDA